jgi:stress-induced morphogen
MLSTTVAQTIEGKLTATLSPIHLDVINESHMHNV